MAYSQRIINGLFLRIMTGSAVFRDFITVKEFVLDKFKDEPNIGRRVLLSGSSVNGNPVYPLRTYF